MFFSVDHLQRLARQGQWDDAIKYVVRFVPKVDAMLGEEGRLLFSFINLHRTIHSIPTPPPAPSGAPACSRPCTATRSSGDSYFFPTVFHYSEGFCMQVRL